MVVPTTVVVKVVGAQLWARTGMTGLLRHGSGATIDGNGVCGSIRTLEVTPIEGVLRESGLIALQACSSVREG